MTTPPTPAHAPAPHTRKHRWQYNAQENTDERSTPTIFTPAGRSTPQRFTPAKALLRLIGFHRLQQRQGEQKTTAMANI